MAAEWWDPKGKFAPLHKFNPTRLSFVRERVVAHFGLDAASTTPFEGFSLLDIGCGGGLLSEPMTRLGADVIGADAGEANIKTARVHAEEQGLKIDYRVTTAEELAASGAQFDVILNMEVIEHVADPAGFLVSCAQMLKPGGIMFCATLNRSLKAFGLAIVGAEYVLRERRNRRHVQSDNRPLVAFNRHGRQLYDGGNQTKANRMTDANIDLEPKNKPRQKRAIETYERVLDVAARLLEEEGVERISTNLIAEKADVTPPTLYRYFPNKYAVLRALGDRLMQEQNEIFEKFLSESGDSIEAQIEGTYENLMETLRVTEQHPGGLSIMRALRAVPTLQQVRLASHHQVTDEWVEHLGGLLPKIPKADLWIKARLTVDIGYAAIEMAMEEPKIASETVLREATTAITAYWQEIIANSK
eukprot:s1_g2131.t1